MDQLQYQWISGTVPKNVLSDNQKKFHIFPEVLSEQDGFLHLLGKGMFVFPTICSLSFHIEAPYQFLYVYEGILSITCENNTHRLSDCLLYTSDAADD